MSGINHYRKRIRTIDKGNAKSLCPMCGENEYLEHVMLCEKNKEEREEWKK